MHKINLPFDGGVAFHNGSEEEVDNAQKLIDVRAKYSLDYMKKMGWGEDVNSLTLDQVLEIGDQEEWKHPFGGDQ